MKQIPTAENIVDTIDDEYFKINGYYLSTTMPIEFAKQVAITLTKLHVEAALKAASKKAKCCDDAIVNLGHTIIEAYVEEDSILNAYPLTNIK